MKKLGLIVLALLMVSNVFAAAKISQNGCNYVIFDNYWDPSPKEVLTIKSEMTKKGYNFIRQNDYSVDQHFELNLYIGRGFNPSVVASIIDYVTKDEVTRTAYGSIARIALRVGTFGATHHGNMAQVYKRAIEKLPSCEQFHEVAFAENI